jgi:uncharacterized membrane protein YgcG
MLHPLLLAHGVWSYHRIADLVKFIFYKATLVSFTQFYSGFFSGFSGQQFFNDQLYQLFNILFTSMPVIIVAVLDQPLPKDVLENNPQVYKDGKGKSFNSRVFLGWLVRALLHSFILFFVPYNLIGSTIVTTNGQSTGMWVFSTVVYQCAALIATLIIMFDMISVTIIHVATLVVSVVAMYLLLFPMEEMLSFNPNLYGVVDVVLKSPTCWLTVLMVLTVPTLFEFARRAAKREFKPSLTQVYQERLTTEYKNTYTRAEMQQHNSTFPMVSPTRIMRGHNKPTESKNRFSVIGRLGGRFNRAMKGSVSQKMGGEQDGRKLSLFATGDPELLGRPGMSEENERQKHAAMRAMLRFRNLTGTAFDSAADARHIQHDKPDGGAGVISESDSDSDSDSAGDSDGGGSKEQSDASLLKGGGGGKKHGGGGGKKKGGGESYIEMT